MITVLNLKCIGLFFKISTQLCGASLNCISLSISDNFSYMESITFDVGEIVRCKFHGQLYEAKVLKVNNEDPDNGVYLIHYQVSGFEFVITGVKLKLESSRDGIKSMTSMCLNHRS